MTEDDNKDIIFATSSYEQKFYFSKDAQVLPESIKEDIKYLAILLTEKVGGVFTIGFYKDDGELFLDFAYNHDDVFYDDIGAKLEIKKLYRENREFFEDLTNWYRVFVINKK
ncbi:MAG: DUF6145 family protein [bacterium]